jgi:O-antigen/teichoic acid export membrane protein
MVPMVLMPLAVRKLGTDTFGRWLLASAAATYVAQNVGIPQVLVDTAARGARVAVEAWHGFIALAGLAVLAFATTLLLSRYFGADRSLLLVGVGIASASLPFSVARGLAEGFQEVHELNVLASAATVLGVLAACVALLALPTTYWLFAPALATSLALVISYRRQRRRHPSLVYDGPFSGREVGSLLRKGAWFALLGGAWTIIYGTDVWVIRLRLGLHEVAGYALTFMVFSLLAEPMGALVMALRPVAAQRAGDAGQLRTLFARSMRLSIGASVLLNGLGVMWCAPVVALWSARQCTVDMRVAVVLGIFQCIRAILNASAWMLVPVEGPRPTAVALTVDAVVNLVASLLLAKAFGVFGVAVGTLVGSIACSGWWIPRRGFIHFGVRLRDCIPVAAILAAMPLWCAAALPRWSDIALSRPILGVAALFVTSVWVVFAGAAFALDPSERDRISARFRR